MSALPQGLSSGLPVPTGTAGRRSCSPEGIRRMLADPHLVSPATCTVSPYRLKGPCAALLFLRVDPTPKVYRVVYHPRLSRVSKILIRGIGRGCVVGEQGWPAPAGSFLSKAQPGQPDLPVWRPPDRMTARQAAQRCDSVRPEHHHSRARPQHGRIQRKLSKAQSDQQHTPTFPTSFPLV